MPAPHALFFTIDSSEKMNSSKELELEDKTPAPHGIRGIFRYLGMYVCILDDDSLRKKTLNDFTPEQKAKAAGKRWSEKDQLSNLMTTEIIKPIIKSILPQIDNFNFQWALVSLNELLEWPPKSTSTAALLKELVGTSGGGSRGG